MDYQFLIIGAGVVGLAAAEQLSHSSNSVLVIEKENRIGTGVSSRNSEVIHAGIYYPKNSLKSLLCIRGNHLLYEYCGRYKINHRRTGKYIIAQDNSELENLDQIRENACNAGMEKLYPVTAREIIDKEKDIKCFGGLFSPASGIVSVHELMDSLKHNSEEKGVDYVFNSRLHTVSKSSAGYIAEIINNSGEIAKVKVERIINCAGLYCDKVSEIIGIKNDFYKIKFSKGNYFRLTGLKHSISHLIYPVPVPKLKGLGIHITLDLNNQVKFGPDIEDMQENIEEYQVNESRAESFYKAVKNYFPAVEQENLVPDISGIRPRLAAEKDFLDFIINEETEAGFPGVINCIGLESPGLTASLAIAEYIKEKLF